MKFKYYFKEPGKSGEYRFCEDPNFTLTKLLGYQDTCASVFCVWNGCYCAFDDDGIMNDREYHFNIDKENAIFGNIILFRENPKGTDDDYMEDVTELDVLQLKANMYYVAKTDRPTKEDVRKWRDRLAQELLELMDRK